ncbi:MAG TPA: hypothetical protein PKM41_02185 [Deltaproteobacteria bacterium]|jgi:hypothetical protein|nr:hypothetical protein [Deltaproteobacteria bacterium]HOI05658.1 hypothetical protein [Deltaproteobacteria bacterium]
MRRFQWFFMAAALLLLVPMAQAQAGDFDWTRDFNIRAEADPSGFRSKLSTRFNLIGEKIDAVLGIADKPADAYMILRLGEMSGRPPEYVVERYRAQKGQGWGALAKSLGIKPGSPEFHALKRGDNHLYADGKGRGKKDIDRKGKGGKGKKDKD